MPVKASKIHAALVVPTVKKVADAGVKKKPKTTLSLDELADRLGLGKSRRKVLRGGGQMMRAWGGEWDADQIGELFRKSKTFANLFLILMAGENMGLVTASVTQVSTADSFRVQSVAWWATNNTWSQASVAAKSVARDLARMSNEARVHPLDMAAIAITSAKNDAAANGRRDGLSQLIARADFTGGRKTDDLLTIARTLKLASRGMSSSRNSLFLSASRMVRALDKFAGYARSGNLSPWRRQGGASKVIAAEVVELEYMLPTEFDDDGKPVWGRGVTVVTHKMAAIEAEERSSTIGEGVAAMKLTPAGRVFLCQSVVGERQVRGLFLGSERAPSRRLFLTHEVSPNDAALAGHTAGTPVSGLVI